MHGTSGLTEADVIRWVGIILGVIGTVVAASNGAVWISSRFVVHLSALLRWLRFHLARWLPFLRRSALVVPLTATVTASSEGSAVLTVARLWDPNAPAELKVDVLHEHIEKLERQIDEIQKHLSERHARLDQKVDALTGKLQKETFALRRRLDNEQQEAARVDARGLPLIGLGVVLSSVPDGLAQVAAVGWLLVAGAGVIAMVVVRSSLRSRHASP